MNKAYEQVKRFHEAIGEEMATKPTMLDNSAIYNLESYAMRLDEICKGMKRSAADGLGDDVLIRSAYILEELIEFMLATSLEDQADALGDKMYFILGTFTKMGLLPEEIFNIIANSNLGKILPDGTVLRDDETGKIQKPPGWLENFAPEPLIRVEIECQSNPTKGFQGGD